MKLLLLSYSRTTFWAIGVITVLLGVIVLATAGWHAASQPASFLIAALFALLMASVGMVTCFAARALRSQGRFAKTLVAFASIYSLVIFPFGTVAGLVGLYWCLSSTMRGLEPLVADFDFQSKKGDGTRKWIQGAVSVGSIVIMLGSLEAARWWGVKHGLPEHAVINGLVLLFVCEWISVFLHEMGHAVAGWTVGMRLAAFSVGPLMAQKKAGRWKFRFTLASLIGLGGSAGTVPVHLRNLRRRMAVEVAAGPIASLVTTVIALSVLSTMPGSPWVMWWKVPAVVAAMSAGAVAINLIPFGSAAGYSDGALLIQVLFGGPFAEIGQATKMIGATRVTAMRPRDVDAAALSRAAEASAGNPDAGSIRMIQMICAVDRGDFALARVCLDSALGDSGSPQKVNDPGVAAEVAFYLAYLDGHAGRAGQWLHDSQALAQKRGFRLAADFDYWRAVAAVRQAEGRNAEADDAWRQAEHLAKRFPKVGLYEYERDLLSRLRERDWCRPAEAVQGEGSV